jgi:hypothetical protein
VFTAVTDSNGIFSYQGIPGGVHQVTFSNPLYTDTTYTVEINDNLLNEDFIVNLFFGSEDATWGDVGGQLFV